METDRVVHWTGRNGGGRQALIAAALDKQWGKETGAVYAAKDGLIERDALDEYPAESNINIIIIQIYSSHHREIADDFFPFYSKRCLGGMSVSHLLGPIGRMIFFFPGSSFFAQPTRRLVWFSGSAEGRGKSKDSRSIRAVRFPTQKKNQPSTWATSSFVPRWSEHFWSLRLKFHTWYIVASTNLPFYTVDTVEYTAGCLRG